MKVLLVFPNDAPPEEDAQDALAHAIVDWAYRYGVQVSINCFRALPNGKEEGTTLADVYPFGAALGAPEVARAMLKTAQRMTRATDELEADIAAAIPRGVTLPGQVMP